MAEGKCIETQGPSNPLRSGRHDKVVLLAKQNLRRREGFKSEREPDEESAGSRLRPVGKIISASPESLKLPGRYRTISRVQKISNMFVDKFAKFS
jgi:hypothetical protein